MPSFPTIEDARKDQEDRGSLEASNESGIPYQVVVVYGKRRLGLSSIALKEMWAAHEM